jgi:glycosyltransferase involved in cell wall biosynthesis
LSTAGTLLFARILLLVRRLHDDGRIDLIHAHAPLPCGHAAGRLSKELGIPFVVSVHGLDAFSTNQVRGLPAKWCERVSRMVFASAERVICVSERVRDEVARGAHAAKTVVVYNGVDPQMFSPSDTQTEPIVCSIGDLIAIKGHHALIRAIALVAKAHPAVRLEIIGTGPERENLATLAHELGVVDRIAFLGRRSRQQVADALRHCSVFALPSRYEGLGCVYLEAMAAEKPVIACYGQGITEIVQNGGNSFLVEPDNAEQIAAALFKLLENSSVRERMGAAGRRTVLQGLTMQHQARRLVEVYEDCLR